MFLFLDHIFSTFGLTFVTISFLSAINFSLFFGGGGILPTVYVCFKKIFVYVGGGGGFYPLFKSVLKRFLYMYQF